MTRRRPSISWHTLAAMLGAALVVVATACSSTKHVPQGKLLLDRARVIIDDNADHHDIQQKQLATYLRQTENHKVLGGLKLQLAIYNISGKDSTNWFNKWIRRVGAPPVIYDSALTTASVKQLQTALKNKGYVHNAVTIDYQPDSAKRKARVDYHITLGQPYRIRSVKYNISDATLYDIITEDTLQSPVKQGETLDLTMLDTWRTAVTERLRHEGYFAFSKDYITFDADTAAGSNDVDLTVSTQQPEKIERMPYYTGHRPFYIRSVNYVTNYDPVTMHDGKYFATDTTAYGLINVLHDGAPYIRFKTLDENNFIIPGQRYDVNEVDRTYRALSRLGVLRFINIDCQPVGEIDGRLWIDAYVLLTTGRSQTVSASLEGTNSEGDLGFGVGVDYQHRNLFEGSERLDAKVKVSYQSLSGKVSGLINDNYSEYSANVGLTFPKFKMPFLRREFKRKIQASTELAVNFNFQQRPEYTRIIAGAAWRYNWSQQQYNLRHTLNLIDLNYVYLPKSRADFLDHIINPLIRYSYENHFIMRLGYNFYTTNKRQSSPLRTNFQRNVYTLRAAAETAGNTLYAISRATSQNKKQDDVYKVFGIRYSQYAKLDADYSLTHYFDTRSSLAFRVGAGIAVPYGNSTVLPFEKRFYSGGANSVRGWGVRALGPGGFSAENSPYYFIYQCGDIRFDANIEFRSKLFWVIELGAFVDAGNVWTIRDYEDQPDGVFKFDKFYKQIALAYGIGIRLDFNYFLVRLDLGMKAHNPAEGEDHWPIANPDWKRDHEFHFSVGYPF